MSESELSPPALREGRIQATVGGVVPPTAPAASGERIVRLQQDDVSLEFMAARANRYQAAARVLGWQFVLILSTAVAAYFKPRVTGAAMLIDVWIAAALFIELWLDAVQERRREEGATIQEMYDRRLFFGQTSAGEWEDEIPVETRNCWASEALKHASARQKSEWREWYPVAVAQLPLGLARLACQRTNAWWDHNQRDRFASWLLTAGALLIVSILTLAIIPDLSRAEVRDQVIVWLPLPYWLMREALRQRRAARAGQRILDHAMMAIHRAVDTPHLVDEESLRQSAETLQSATLRRRQDNPMVPRWFYRLHRQQNEGAVGRGVEDILARLHREP